MLRFPTSVIVIKANEGGPPRNVIGACEGIRPAPLVRSGCCSQRKEKMHELNEIILLIHVLFGVGCILAAIWVFVDVLNVNETNLNRIRWLSRASAMFMWLAFAIGGYWYVVFYPADKAIILQGPWPFAHSYFMETKEHLVIMLLLLATYLPIAASNQLTANKEARRLVLWVAAMIPLLGLMIEGHGAIISMGVKVALLAKQL
jgi:hypothetical protein